MNNITRSTHLLLFFSKDFFFRESRSKKIDYLKINTPATVRTRSMPATAARTRLVSVLLLVVLFVLLFSLLDIVNFLVLGEVVDGFGS